MLRRVLRRGVKGCLREQSTRQGENHSLYIEDLFNRVNLGLMQS